MATDIFHNGTKTVPRSDSRIERVDFDKEDIGARRSHLPKIGKNQYSIKHVTSK